MGHHHKRIISLTVILFFTWLTFTINVSFPQRAFAEGLAISGLQCKTAEFKPYLEKGQFSYFLNQPASVTAEIQDNDFNLVRKFQFMQMEEAGENIIMWDGKDEKGNFIKDGEFFLSVTAMGGQGLAVASSIGMKMAFDAPMGTEFKGHLSRLGGRVKKEYPSEVPTKFQSQDALPTGCVLTFGYIVWGVISIIFGPVYLFCALFEEKKIEYIAWVFNPNRCAELMVKEGYYGLESVPDNEKYEKIKKEADKHNSRIDAKIANENRKIDAYNQKIKESLTIRISLTD